MEPNLIIKLEIETGNSELQENLPLFLYHRLRFLADRIREGSVPVTRDYQETVFDTNGNTIGDLFIEVLL